MGRRGSERLFFFDFLFLSLFLLLMLSVDNNSKVHGQRHGEAYETAHPLESSAVLLSNLTQHCGWTLCRMSSKFTKKKKKKNAVAMQLKLFTG